MLIIIKSKTLKLCPNNLALKQFIQNQYKHHTFYVINPNASKKAYKIMQKSYIVTTTNMSPQY